MKITEMTNKKNLSPEDIIEIISFIGSNKDTIIIKNDGVRGTSNYTVLVISSKDPEKSYRCDDSSLQMAVKKVLETYIMW